jgi:surfeit locus 1 family protein
MSRGASAPTAARWTGRRLVALVAGLALALVTARLGWWQLDRAGQKLDLQARLQARAALPPLQPAELPRDAAAAAAQYDRAAVLQGHWLPQRTVYLENRQMDGRPGFYVVTPLQLAGGDVVLVQRGWMPRDFLDRSRLQPLPAQPGPVQVAGRLAPPPSRLLALGSAASGPIRQNLDLQSFGAEIGLVVRPWSLLQTQATVAAAGTAAQPLPDDGLQRRWPAVASDVGKHHGYAAQWFGLSGLLLALTLWFQVLAPWRAARRSPDPLSTAR